ncbi:hypothetical protein FB451DRAFT_1454232 [Mycena latifolia]|nr:hypothetical protein FB451DRAFT_1454232 [Mycena latifolia]
MQTPHRVEPYPMSSAHPQARLSRRPAPGSFLETTLLAPRPPRVPVPIAMLPTHSGSPSPSADSSLDRSAQHHYAAYDLPRDYPGDYMHTPPPPPPQYHPHPHVHPDEHHRSDDHAQYAPQPFPIAHGGGSMAPPQGSEGGAGGIQAVHTDDVPTKLSDRVRRRCFNCCTTNTTVQQMRPLRSTHSRARPEQFPHKRGPLASSTLPLRSPPGRSPTKPPPTTPGPVSYPTSASAPPPSHGAPSTPNPSAPANDFASVNSSTNGQHNGSASHPGTPNCRQREERDDRRERSLE